MFSPETLAFRIGSLVEVWHKDPCKDGSDDSCGWSLRARHVDPILRDTVRCDFDYHMRYWYDDDGKPLYSKHALGLMMFRSAAFHVFRMNSHKTDKWISHNLHSILWFSENTVDCLFSSNIDLSDKSLKGWGRTKKEQINSFADCVLAYIMSDIRPWYKHPRFHIRHWTLSFPLFRQWKYQFKRWVKGSSL
jgi:hypothetical protein